MDDYASLDDERDEEETRSTLRAMCEASRGRQLRLIRAETDSGRSDGLLNTLTCRQPSARLHFLRPSTCVIYDATESLASADVRVRTLPLCMRDVRFAYRSSLRPRDSSSLRSSDLPDLRDSRFLRSESNIVLISLPHEKSRRFEQLFFRESYFSFVFL